MQFSKLATVVVYVVMYFLPSLSKQLYLNDIFLTKLLFVSGLQH